MQKLFMTMLVMSLLNLNIMTMDSKSNQEDPDSSQIEERLNTILSNNTQNYSYLMGLIASDPFNSLNFNERYNLIPSLNNNPTTDNDVQVKAVKLGLGPKKFTELDRTKYCKIITLAQKEVSYFGHPSVLEMGNKDLQIQKDIMTRKDILNYNLHEEMIKIAGGQDALKSLTKSQNYHQLLQQAKNNINYHEKMERLQSMGNDRQQMMYR